MRQSRSRDGSRRRGFSLPELIVSIGIVAVLFSLLTPALGRAKRDAVELRCVTRAGELARLVHAYAVDHRGMPPMIYSDDPMQLRTLRQQIRYMNQSISALRGEMWRAWSGADETLYRCGAHYSGRENYPRPVDFRIARCVFARPEVFARDVPNGSFPSDFGARGQRVDAVIFPDAKAVLFESKVWHGFPGDGTPGTDVGTLEYSNSPRPSAVAFFDGHASLRWPRDARAPVYAGWIWSVGPYATTRDGVRGRDF
ncbi:MAG: type II secretion system protein [Planctomycetota bacterium]|nr:type II secretion system protein [Planctomycetota bacterium]